MSGLDTEFVEDEVFSSEEEDDAGMLTSSSVLTAQAHTMELGFVDRT